MEKQMETDEFIKKGNFEGKQHLSPTKNIAQMPPKQPSKKSGETPSDKKVDSPPNKKRGHHKRQESYDMNDLKEAKIEKQASVGNSSNDGHYMGVSFGIDLSKLSVSRRRSSEK